MVVMVEDLVVMVEDLVVMVVDLGATVVAVVVITDMVGMVMEEAMDGVEVWVEEAAVVEAAVVEAVTDGVDQRCLC